MSIYTTMQESYILLATLYGGILLGFIYDLYRIFRGFFNPKKIASMIQDLIFWGIICLIAFYVIIFSNQGDIRFYNFLGFILGAVIYNFLLSKVAIRGLVFMLKCVKKFALDLFNILKYPFSVAFCLVSGPYSYCKKKIKPVYYKAKRIARIPKIFLMDTKKSIGNYLKKT